MIQLSKTDVQNLQNLIAQRGLSRSQVQAQFGLDDGTMNWLGSTGVSFAPEGTAPRPLVAPASLPSAGGLYSASAAPFSKGLGTTDSAPWSPGTPTSSNSPTSGGPLGIATSATTGAAPMPGGQTGYNADGTLNSFGQGTADYWANAMSPNPTNPGAETTGNTGLTDLGGMPPHYYDSGPEGDAARAAAQAQLTAQAGGTPAAGQFTPASQLPNVVNGVQTMPGVGEGWNNPGAVGFGGMTPQDIYRMQANPDLARGTPYEQFIRGGGSTGAPESFARGNAMWAYRTGGTASTGLGATQLRQDQRADRRAASDAAIAQASGAHQGIGGQPQAGLMTAASMGQGNDTQIGHLTPGEGVVPREIMAARPDVRATIDTAIAQAGGNPDKYKVGRGYVNPRTGIQQFDSEPSIQDWYRNVAGRDPRQDEIDYWKNQAATMGGQQAFQSFVGGLQANGEMVKTSDYAAANTPYTGTQSANSSSIVDDWARNVFGRAATPQEIAQFSAPQTPQQSQQFYNDFVAAGKAAGQNAANLTWAQASQIAAVPETNGVVIPTPGVPTPNYTHSNGLFDSMAVPAAAQAEQVHLGATTQAQGGPQVAAGQGTAGSYTATTATAAPAVAAGTGSAAQATSQGYNSTDATAALRGDSQVHGYDANTGTAAQWDVDPNQTVQGQIRNIIDENSPLQQGAKTRALQEQNARGTLNSTMAVQAGQKALYDAALPIAQQDANTYAQRGQFNAGTRQQMELANMDAKNTASRFYATAKNEAAGQNAQLGTQVNLSNAAERNKAAEFTAASATDVSKFNAASANDMTKTNLANALQAGIVNQEQANKMAALAAESINRASEFNITTNAQMQQFNIDEALKAGIVNSQQAQQLSEFNAQQANQMNAAQAELDSKVAMFNASQSNDLIKLGMDSQTKVALGNIEANYKTLMQASSSASSLYQQAMNNLTQILTNKDLSGAAKAAATQNLVGALNGSLGVIGGIANLDLPSLEFGDVNNAPAAEPVTGLGDLFRRDDMQGGGD